MFRKLEKFKPYLLKYRDCVLRFFSSCIKWTSFVENCKEYFWLLTASQCTLYNVHVQYIAFMFNQLTNQKSINNNFNPQKEKLRPNQTEK